MSADSITRVFRAKLKALQKEMEALQIDYTKRVCHKILNDLLGKFFTIKSISCL